LDAIGRPWEAKYKKNPKKSESWEAFWTTQSIKNDAKTKKKQTRHDIEKTTQNDHKDLRKQQLFHSSVDTKNMVLYWFFIYETQSRLFLDKTTLRVDFVQKETRLESTFRRLVQTFVDFWSTRLE
jgi:hypothetical protein